MKYNFLTWWLSISIKPLAYKIWKYIITFVMFMGWVICIAIYRDLYWKFSLFVLLPTAIVDISWDAINYHFYLKKQRTKTQNSNDLSDHTLCDNQLSPTQQDDINN